MFWRRRKALAAYNNRWQWLREFSPAISSAFEILLENGTDYLVIESSVSSAPTYIITE
jgi:hypothetical protein